MIRATSVSFAYAGETEWSLRDITAEIPSGITALIGGNASGKTTFGLVCVAAIPHWIKAEAWRGSCFIAGMPMTADDFGRTTHALFQGVGHSFIGQTVDEELYLMGEDASTADAIRRLLSSVLPSKVSFGQLSRGERTVAAAVLAVARGRAVTFLDETFESLDDENELVLAEFLAAHRPEQRAILVSAQPGRALQVPVDRHLYVSGGVLSGDRPADNRLPCIEQSKPAHIGSIILQCEDVSLAFDNRRILRNASLEIRGGEAVALTGRNGAGKTTLMRVLAGLQNADDGTIVVRRRRAQAGDLRSISRLCSSDPDLELFESSVIREISAEPRLKALPKPRRREMVQQYIDRLPFAPHVDPAKLSFGQRKLLLLACAFAGEPELLLIDEPTTGLDTSGIERLALWIREYLADGSRAVVLASQSFAHIESLCHRRVHLQRGILSW